MQVFARDNDVNAALRVLTQKMQREGTFRDMTRSRSICGRSRCNTSGWPNAPITIRPQPAPDGYSAGVREHRAPPIKYGAQESEICQHNTSLRLARPCDFRPIWAKAAQAPQASRSFACCPKRPAFSNTGLRASWTAMSA